MDHEFLEDINRLPLNDLKALCTAAQPALDLQIALRAGISARTVAICDHYDLDGVQMRAIGLQERGAAAIAVVTEAERIEFGLKALGLVKEAVAIPVLLKDAIVDEYQVYQARKAGADSVVLSCALVDVAMLQYLIEVGRELEMEALVEVKTSADLRLAMQTDAKLIWLSSTGLIEKLSQEQRRKRNFILASEG